MRVGFWCLVPYADKQIKGWPNAPAVYEREWGLRTDQNLLEQAQAADQLGFDFVSVAEHHYWALAPTPNAALMLAALAKVTEQARLAWLGPLVPISNPVRIAEEIAMLDQLSGGRVMVTFLRGTPNEFLAYGTNPEETRGRTQEATELILRALSEPQPFSWEGRHYRYRTVAVWPGTTQQPLPPFFFSGNSTESAAFAAEHQLGCALSFYSPDRCAGMVDLYREASAKAGWKPGSDQILYRAFMCIGKTDREAQERKARFYGEHHGFWGALRGRGAAVAREFDPGEGGMDGFVEGMLRFCGSPDTVVEQINAVYEQIGMGHLDLAFTGGGLSHDDTLDSLRLFAEEVLPHLRDLGVESSASDTAAITA